MLSVRIATRQGSRNSVGRSCASSRITRIEHLRAQLVDGIWSSLFYQALHATREPIEQVRHRRVDATLKAHRRFHVSFGIEEIGIH